jgi:hypothetical protein
LADPPDTSPADPPEPTALVRVTPPISRNQPRSSAVDWSRRCRPAFLRLGPGQGPGRRPGEVRCPPTHGSREPDPAEAGEGPEFATSRLVDATVQRWPELKRESVWRITNRDQRRSRGGRPISLIKVLPAVVRRATADEGSASVLPEC